ncbi:MAG: hypothetical protein V3S83_12485 [Gemmatimonadota bacterium]
MSKPTFKGAKCEDIKGLANQLNMFKGEGYVCLQLFPQEDGRIDVLATLEIQDPTMSKLDALLKDPRRKAIFDNLFDQIMKMEFNDDDGP